MRKSLILTALAGSVLASEDYQSTAQTAKVEAEFSADAKMAVDYGGYYGGSSGNVEEYQSWLVSRPLKYGSNGQTINVLLSTSNKWTILQSKNCTNCYGQSINPSSSKTYKPQNHNINYYLYKDYMNVNGYRSQDVLCFGGICSA